MKRKVSQVIMTLVSGVALVLAAAVLVLAVWQPVASAQAVEKLLVQMNTATMAALIAGAVGFFILGVWCLAESLPKKLPGQRGYVMQRNEAGAIGVSVKAIEGLIRTCVDKHEVIADKKISVEECRDGIIIDLQITQGAGVNIPVSIGALQKQIKQYVQACTGVDVYKIRVMVENDESIPVAPEMAVQDMMFLPTANQDAAPAALPVAQAAEETSPVIIPAPVAEMPRDEHAAYTTVVEDEEEGTLHQRLFKDPEQESTVELPPEQPVEEQPAEAQAEKEQSVPEPDAEAVPSVEEADLASLPNEDETADHAEADEATVNA